MKKVLSIAGSDCSGGAGIQADLKTITCHKMYGMTAITALTAQNTTGVYGILDVTPEFLANQLDCIFTDIYPDAVKIGMVSSPELIDVIVNKLKEYQAKHIVVDPVMVATSGSKLMKDSAYDRLVSRLFPLADIITPNIPELEALSRTKIYSIEDIEKAVMKIRDFYGGNLLVKGGHFGSNANDFLFYQDRMVILQGERIKNENTHGTGCTLSSAIACNLAKGLDIEESVKRGKQYITDTINAMLDLGKGRGPLMHNCNIIIKSI
jgi:hydroxymethylpyrimidine/phosphomethylpyrimidine kinase